MNLILFSLMFATMCISCRSTMESCPVIHKSSQLTINQHVVMYAHVIGYCSVEEKIYGPDTNIVQDWIKANPNKPVYHTIWGTFSFESLIGIYFIHFAIGTFVLACWLLILDEVERTRKRQSIITLSQSESYTAAHTSKSP
jgi:hypothetical protein